MSGTFSGIEMGKRALMAQSQAISTAGHNISNADTEGYSRQRVQLKQFDPIYRPDLSRAGVPGQIGQGVTAESISRIRDELLDSRIAAQAHEESYWKTRSDYYAMIESVYNEPNDVSVRTAMDKFWESWQELSLYPETKAAREAVVSRGENFAQAVRSRHQSFAAIGAQLNGDIEATVKQINDFAGRIAKINVEIARSEAMGDNPNDLYDQRDLMVDKLAKLANITTDTRDRDEFMVHLDGHVLVQGGIARGFDTVPVLDDNGYTRVIWNDTKETAHVSGGSLGALIELRDVDLRGEMQSLNTMAMNFVDMVNDVHRNAWGANSTTGLDFFVEQSFVNNALGNFDRDADGELDSSYIFRFTGTNALDLHEQTGLAGTITISGKTDNISIDYRPTDTVETIINRINDADGEVKAYLDRNDRLVLKAVASANAENPDFVIRHVEDSGFFLTGYSGILKERGEAGAYDFARPNAVSALVGDGGGADVGGAQFAVAPVANPAGYLEVNAAIRNDVLSVAAAFKSENGSVELGDASAAIAISALRNTRVMVGEFKTFDDYFADSVTRVGLKGEQAELNYETQVALMGDLRSLRESISGVNIDEELADIIKFQHGYNAAAKIVSVMDSLLDTVINGLVRG